MKQIRVLHILDSLSNGGTEAFIMNVYRNIDRQKVQFDFLIRRNINCFEDEIKRMGGRVYLTPPFPKRAINNYIETKKVLKNNEYKIVHLHANSLVYISPLIIAKKMRIPQIIVHSHSTKASSSKLLPIHNFNRKIIENISTDLFACSINAGRWMYGKNSFEIIYNGVDLDKFKFREEFNLEIRKEFNISENELIIGHVGRFVDVKNHDFIIGVFNEVLKIIPNSKLILIGTGKLEEKVKQKVQNLKIENKVIFTGVRNDINKFMSTFDILLFPSWFEGLPVVLVEAQSAGLNCLISDNITDEVILSDLVKKKSLTELPRYWAEELITMNSNSNFQDLNETINKTGYNIKEVAKKLQNHYLKSIETGELSNEC